jgi:hypothetical protein
VVSKRRRFTAERIETLISASHCDKKTLYLHALGLVQYLRTIGYKAWIEDTNGNEIDEKALQMVIRSRHEDAPSS